MARTSRVDSLDDYLERMPEPKLELIDGRLIVGNGLVGSRHLLWEILCGYGAEAALAMAPRGKWLQALHEAFSSVHAPRFDDDHAVRGWAKGVVHDPCILPAGPMVDGPHRQVQQLTMFALSQTACAHGLGDVMGRDVIMWIDPHAVTPDAFLVGRDRRESMKKRYCQGRADMVIEVLLRGHEPQDRELKHRLYEAARIPEYWLIDLRRESIDFLRLTGAVYQERRPDSDGWYRPLWTRGLAFSPARFWECVRQGRDFPGSGPGFFAGEGEVRPMEARPLSKEGMDWADIPFRPAPDLLPRPIPFEEFACWCPEAKFEGDGRRIIVGSRLGTRNVLGMLLRTFGLVEAAKVLHPRQWRQGLKKQEIRTRLDVARRDKWRQFARSAADVLRNQFGWRRIAIIGDMTRPDPLNYWSELILVRRDSSHHSTWEAYCEVRSLQRGILFDLINDVHANGEERQLLTESAIDV